VAPLICETDQTRPEAVIKRLNDALLEAMRGSEALGFSGRYKLLEPVIEACFAFPFVTRVSTGRFWKDLEMEQKERLLRYYIAWSVAT
jgi:phospholipid transport system substrate-binding protein